MDVLHEYTLVLEHITLRLHVERMVQMPINLLGCSILQQQLTKNPLSLNPEFLERIVIISGDLETALRLHNHRSFYKIDGNSFALINFYLYRIFFDFEVRVNKQVRYTSPDCIANFNQMGMQVRVCLNEG